MNLLNVLLPAIILISLAMIFSAILAVLSEKLAVKENEKIKEIQSLLSGANCGACGFAGCKGFAEALVSGKADINTCNATSIENKKKIAEILNITSFSTNETIAVVACNGGNNTENKFDYQGFTDCKSAALVSGGYKACAYGCLGGGTCANVCNSDAASINCQNIGEINRSLCVKCGLCVNACPKRIIKFIPASAKVYVKCSNHDKGAAVKNICSKGCIACGLCAKICPENAVALIDNLPEIDYTKCVGCGLCAQKCPTEAITRL